MSDLTELIYVMEVAHEWHVRLPGAIEAKVFATKELAVDDAREHAWLRRCVSGNRVLVRIRDQAGAWAEWDPDGTIREVRTQ